MTKDKNLIRVLGEENLARDPKTGAILCVNDTARRDYEKRKNRNRNLEARITTVENQLSELTSQLQTLITILQK